jgi:hypothetical protein
VYTPDGDVLDKHLHVLRRAPGGFDWGPEADEARIDQLAIALLADSTTKDIALDHYKEFAEFLREELKGDEWRLPTSDISTDTWSRDISVHQSADDRREELEAARETVRSETDDSEESRTDTGGFEFPVAGQ